jgi:hypothetical protein
MSLKVYYFFLLIVLLLIKQRISQSNNIEEEENPSNEIPSGFSPSSTEIPDINPSNQTNFHPNNSDSKPSPNLPQYDVNKTICSDFNSLNKNCSQPKQDNKTNKFSEDNQLINRDYLEGTFLEEARKYSVNMPNSSTLDFVFLLTTPGLTRPEDLLQGYFTKVEESEEESESESPSNSNNSGDPATSSDVFKMKWNITSNQMDSQGLESVKNLAEKIISFYKNNLTFLTLNDTSEIVFITNEKTSSLVFEKSLLTSLYGALSEYYIAEVPFSFESYNSTYFNPKNNISALSQTSQFIPKVAQLQDDYISIKMGFSFFKQCSKMLNYKRFSDSDGILIVELSQFSDVLSLWAEKFLKQNSKSNQTFYDVRGNSYFSDLSLEQLKENFTLTWVLTKTLLADLTRFKNEQEKMDILKKYLPDENTDRLKSLYKFLSFKVILSSELYTYLMISPFMYFMIEKFNTRILNDKSTNSYYNKLVHFTLDEISISAFYKIFNYESKKKNSDNNDLSYLESYPFVSYDFSISFELWKDKTSESGDYYVVARENFSELPLFSVSVQNFSILLEMIMISPDFTLKERIFYCGTKVNNKI